jgi:hypothetical protein
MAPRPKREPDRDRVIGVRLSEAEHETISQAIAKEMEGVTGATPSLPKFLLRAGLDRAKTILAKK